MIIYNPENMIPSRVKEAEQVLRQLPQKYCFITGSFLYEENYKDIDLFIITRSKKEIKIDDDRLTVTKIDFNMLYSLFHHSISKSCVANNILPKKPLKLTIADYWHVINEAIPNILNNKEKWRKEARFVILYTEYLKNNKILSSYELKRKLNKIPSYKKLFKLIEKTAPEIINKKIKKNYIKRYFYEWRGVYKDFIADDCTKYLYTLCHNIIYY